MQHSEPGPARATRLLARTLVSLWRGTVASLTVISAFALSTMPAWSGERVYRLGFLTGPIAWSTPTSMTAHLGFMGYKQGNFVYEERSTGGTTARLAELATELVTLKVDVIVTDDAASARAAAAATETIPIVTLLQVNPVKMGLVESLAHPGRNITGVLMYEETSIAKKLELLEEFVTGLERVGVIFNPATPHGADAWHQAQAIASVRGLKFEPLAVELMKEPEPAFKAALNAKCQALLVIEDNASYRHNIAISRFALEHRLPVIYPYDGYIRYGEGLAAYGPDTLEAMQALASLVDQILKGADPAELPLVRTTRFELVVSRIAADAIGMEIPSSILAQASRVIE